MTAPIIKSATASWAVYALLVALRVACAGLPGYVHPDEFFQGGQELFFGQGNVGGVDAQDRLTTTWEFAPDNAIRSIVPPVFMTLLPLRLYVIIMGVSVHVFAALVGDSVREDCARPQQWSDDLTGWEILIVPRAFLALLSVATVDVSVWTLCSDTFNGTRDEENESDFEDVQGRVANVTRPGQQCVPNEILLLATSWPALVLLNRPFTNTLEAMCLACLMALVARDAGTCRRRVAVGVTPGMAIPLAVGMLCSIGLFVRFTFAFFAFPVVIQYLHGRGAVAGRLSRCEGKEGARLRPYTTAAAKTALSMAMGFIATSSAFVFADTSFYRSRSINEPSANVMPSAGGEISGLFITPLNALLYNARSDNLSEHGLHPRVTHALVNMPMLYGPVAIFFYATLLSRFFPVGKRDRQCHAESSRESGQNVWAPMCEMVTCSGLFVLSCAPHQEPRFLLPLLAPLIVGMWHEGATCALLGRFRPVFILFWLVFNLLLGMFFGGLHQAGVVPTLLRCNPNDSAYFGKTFDTALSTEVIFFHTYMPPSFLRLSHVEHTSLQTRCDTTREAICVESGSEDMQSCAKSDYGGSIPRKGHERQLIIDLKGADYQILRKQLKETLFCDTAEKEGKVEVPSKSKPLAHVHQAVMVVAPFTVVNCEARNELLQDFRCEELFSLSPHVGTEDMPVWKWELSSYLEEMKLVVNRFGCR